MTKTAKKKKGKKVEIAKIEKKIDKKRSKTPKGKSLARFEQNPIPYKSLNSRTGAPARGAKAGGSIAAAGESVRKDTAEYCYSLLNGKDAFDRGLTPSYPDGSPVTAFRWGTKTVQNLASASNAFNGTQDVWVKIQPFGQSHITYTTTWTGAGLPNVQVTTNVNGYGNWVASFQQVRCVFMYAVIRETTIVANQGGVALQANIKNANLESYSFSVMAAAFREATRGLGNPGDIGTIAWLPDRDTSIYDTAFWSPATTAQGTSTNILLWNASPQAQSFILEVYAGWEALPIPSLSSILGVVTKMGDPSQMAVTLKGLLDASPPTSQGRNVQKDDGVWEQAAKDATTVVKAIPAAVNLFKGAAKGVSDVVGFLGGLFSETMHTRLHRQLYLLDNEMFYALVEYITAHPGCTLSDLLAHFAPPPVVTPSRTYRGPMVMPSCEEEKKEDSWERTSDTPSQMAVRLSERFAPSVPGGTRSQSARR